MAILDFAKHVAERLSNGGDDDSDDDGGDDDSSSGLPKFTCSRTLTEFPAHLFSSDDYSVHEAFCNHWKDSQISGWRVNAKGEHGSANDQAKRQEAVPEDFMGWNFQLKYSPIFEHEGGTPCSLDCNGMYRKLTEECSLDEGMKSLYCPVPPLVALLNDPLGAPSISSFLGFLCDANNYRLLQVV